MYLPSVILNLNGSELYLLVGNNKHVTQFFRVTSRNLRVRQLLSLNNGKHATVRGFKREAHVAVQFLTSQVCSATVDSRDKGHLAKPTCVECR